MAGEGYGLPGNTTAPGQGTIGNSKDAAVSSAYSGMSGMAANNAAGATSGNALNASASATPAAGSTASTTTSQPALSAPPGLLGDNSNSGFQLAAPTTTPGTDIMGVPSWMADYTKAGAPDLNTWYQQHQGGYADMSKPLATPAQLQFAPPPPPPAPVAAPAATPAAPAAPGGNWWTPKSGPAPAVTKNTLWGSTPVSSAELDALPDAFVASQSFLNQYGSSPGAIDYQKWRMGPTAWFGAQDQQNALRQQMGYANLHY